MADGRRAEFEAVFDVGGVWVRLLYEVEGYQQTQIWCEWPETGQYRVKDCWNGHRDFESFRALYQVEFGRFESWIFADGVVKREQFLGAYYEDREDNGDDGLLRESWC